MNHRGALHGTELTNNAYRKDLNCPRSSTVCINICSCSDNRDATIPAFVRSWNCSRIIIIAVQSGHSQVLTIYCYYVHFSLAHRSAHVMVWNKLEQAWHRLSPKLPPSSALPFLIPTVFILSHPFSVSFLIFVFSHLSLSHVLSCLCLCCLFSLFAHFFFSCSHSLSSRVYPLKCDEV